MKALRKMAKSNLIHGAFSLAIFKMAACQEKIPIPIFGSGEDPGDEVGQNIDEHLQSSNSMVLNLNYFIYNCFFTDSKSTLKGCRIWANHLYQADRFSGQNVKTFSLVT